MKLISDTSMDAGLADIADNGNQFHLVSQAPAAYADVATYSLGMAVLILGDGNGSYVIQNGVVSGRRLTLADQAVLGVGDGVATHAVIVDTVNLAIKAVSTAPNYNMQTDVSQAVPEHDVWEIQDPT